MPKQGCREARSSKFKRVRVASDGQDPTLSQKGHTQQYQGGHALDKRIVTIPSDSKILPDKSRQRDEISISSKSSFDSVLMHLRDSVGDDEDESKSHTHAETLSAIKDHKESVEPEPPDSIMLTDDLDSNKCNAHHSQETEILVRKSEGLSLVIDVKVNDFSTTAVVDSAAQVTIISTHLLRQLPVKPFITGRVKLKGIGGPSSEVPADKLSGVTIQLGSVKYTWPVYVAEISDPLLLGLDFLVDKKCKVDLANNCVSVQDEPGEVIHASLKRNTEGEACEVFTVVSAERTVLPPFMICLIPIKVLGSVQPDTSYVIEPVPNAKGLSTSGSLVNEQGFIEAVNETDHYITIKPLARLGTAVEFKMVLSPLDNAETSPSVLSRNDKLTGLIGQSGTETAKLPPVPSLSVNSVSMSNCREQTEAVKGSTESISLEEVQSRMPMHLNDLFHSIPRGAQREHVEQVGELLIQYGGIFAKHDLDLGCLSEVRHKIDTKDHQPVQQRMRRTPLGFEGEEKKHLDSMLAAGVIRPSVSEWASAPVLVRKKDGGVRWCIDFRALNDKTVKDQYPLPLIEDCLDTLAGTIYFSTLDLASGYYQIELEESAKKKTAFITKYGLFEHERMGFGLCNAPATFQRAMNLVLRGLTWTRVLVYLDDIIILGTTFREHLDNLREVFNRMQQYNLKLKPKKCKLLHTEVEFLGRTVSNQGIRITPQKMDAIKNWPVPTTKKELESFLGYANYHRAHIQGYAGITTSLYELVKPKRTFIWTEVQQEAFDALKDALTKAPCLTFPLPVGTFILDCDASGTSIGAELSQIQGGEERTITYASFTLLPQQRRYCITRKELLAVVRFCRNFRHYLLGRPFLVRSDHNCLAWLMRFRHIEGQLARWLEELAQYDFKIIHRAGNKHSNADGLSRIPDTVQQCDCYNAGSKVESLPCGGCRYCQRASEQWVRFTEDVDDVLPLALKMPVYKLRQVKPTVDEEDDGENSMVESDQDEESDTPEPDTNEASQYSLDHSNWLHSYSAKDLNEMQLNDPDLEPLITWLQEGEPDQAELFIASPATKALWLCRSQLQLENGVLRYIWETEPGQQICLVVPFQLKKEVLELCHDTKTAGHLGRDKTLNRLKQSFIWHHMAKDCGLHVMQCSVCNQNKKATRIPRARMKIYQSGFPMERIHLDVLGPFTTSVSGNSYVLMMYDQFSKWLECAAIPDQTAVTTAHQFLLHFVTTFGCPLEIHTDQGKNFESDLFQAFCDRLGIAKTRTTPYNPSSNGAVERQNRNVLQMIRCFIQGQTRDWDQDLPLVVMALHSMVNRSTGFTANQVMLGREVIQPVDIVMGTIKKDLQVKTPAKWVSELTEKMLKIHTAVREKLKASLLHQKRDYDIRMKEDIFEEGDFVYQREKSTKKGLSPKLQPIWKGPFLVTKAKPPLYLIKTRRREKYIHHNNLKRCHDENIPMWLRRARNQLWDQDDLVSDDLGGHPDSQANLGAPKDIGDSDREESTGARPKTKRKREESMVAAEEKRESTPEPLAQTRRGRKIKAPLRFKDYVTE